MAFHRGVADDYQDLLTILEQLATGSAMTAAAVNAGGTGYAVGDILRVSGGTFDLQADVEVTGETAGVVDTVRIYNAGAYSVNPGVASATIPCTGAGSGCTVDTTITSSGWTTQRDTTHTVNGITTEKEVILLGTGGGTNDPYVGVRTYNADGLRARNWECTGFTGFTGPNSWANQPGISPGRFNLSQLGSYTVLTNSRMPYWINYTGRRLIGSALAGGCLSSFYLGYINPFATDAEYPYPLYISGNTDTFDKNILDNSSTSIGSIVSPLGVSATTDSGPGFIRDPAGVWKGFKNYNAFTQRIDSVVYPTGDTNFIGTPTTFIDLKDQIVGSNNLFDAWSSPIAMAQYGPPAVVLAGTPDGANPDKFQLVPATLVRKQSLTDRVIFGELDDCFFVPGGVDGTYVQNQDRYTVGSDHYICFRTGFLSGQQYYWAIKEA